MIKRYDITAFKAQARHIQNGFGLLGVKIKISDLKYSLASQTFNARVCPMIDCGLLLSNMMERAKAAGHDTALFSFWSETRNAEPDSENELEKILDELT